MTEAEGTIVRKEFTGPLIWSDRHKAYFILKHDRHRSMVQGAVDAIAADRTAWATDLEPSVRRDLNVLGVEPGVRIIDSPYHDRLSAPLEVYFDYTWLCNLAREKCGMDAFCYAQDFLGTATMGREATSGLMDQLADWGVMRLHLAGGEPTISKRGLANYLDSATAAGLYASMATNGLLIDDEVCEIILRNDLKSVSFSLDGASEETHGAVRGPGLFDRTVAGIRRLTSARDKAGSRTRVCIKPTYEPDTPDSELEGIVQLGITLGVDVVKFANPERCLHHEQGHYGVNVDAYYEKIFFISKLQEKYGCSVTITNVSNPLAGCGDLGIPGLQGCIGAQELLAINPDGSITPCLMHQRNLGNVLTEYSGLKDFWARSPTLRSFWGELEQPSGCAGCELHSRCRSGSVTRRIVETGRFNHDKTSGSFVGTKDPLCPTDYVARHPGVPVLSPSVPTSGLRNFREVEVRHSL